MIDRHLYNMTKAEDYFCIPSVIQAILRYYKYEISQIDIAKFFNFYMPNNDNFNDFNITITKNKNDFGIKLTNTSINDFFKKNNFPLNEKYHSIDHFEDWEFNDFIDENLTYNYHIVCGYSYGTLFNEQRNIEIGHVSIITKKDNNRIEILNPGPRNYGYQWVDSYKLYSAIKRKTDGIWLIRNLE